MHIARYGLAVVAAALLGGIGMVVWHARGDVLPMAVLMHVNLLGWLSLGLFGLYYCAPGPVRRPRLAWTQATAALLGFVAMSGGSAVLGAGSTLRLAPLVAAGMALAVSALVLFLVQVLGEDRPRALAA